MSVEQSSHRDTFRELRFLEEVSAGNIAFVEQVIGRLDRGQEDYADSWAWVGVRKLLSELLEELSDLGGWGVLCDQALDLEPGISEPDRQRVSAVLHLVARRGASLHDLVTRTLEALDQSRGAS